jgi:hypothetical protein
MAKSSMTPVGAILDAVDHHVAQAGGETGDQREGGRHDDQRDQRGHPLRHDERHEGGDHQEAKQGKIHRRMLREEGVLEGDGDARADRLAAVGAGEGACAIVGVPMDPLNWSRVKLFRYQLAPTVAAQPRPPVSRLV